MLPFAFIGSMELGSLPTAIANLAVIVIVFFIVRDHNVINFSGEKIGEKIAANAAEASSVSSAAQHRQRRGAWAQLVHLISTRDMGCVLRSLPGLHTVRSPPSPATSKASRQRPTWRCSCAGYVLSTTWS